MTRTRQVVLIFACCGTVASIGFSSLTPGQVTMQEPVPASSAGSYVHDEVLVRFKPGMSSQTRLVVMSSMGHRPLQMTLGSRGTALVKLPPGRTVEEATAAYRAMAQVESVQPNYIYKALVAPDDPNYGQLWGLNNTGQTVTGGNFLSSRLAGADMGMEQAWDVNGGNCSSVIVAILDSGVNYTHQDLADNMWAGSAAGFPNHGANFIFGEVASDPMPIDADGHGTHVAATIGAVGNNAVGTTGVCWRVQLMALRVLTVTGGTTASVISGLNFAVTHGAKVVNMSFGGPNFDPAFEDEIIAARDSGVVMVAAAGNDGTNNDDPATPQYPCNFTHDNLICVAALDQAYDHASFSNFGSTSVDVGAPGVNVLSAWPGVTLTNDFSTWTNLSGGWVAANCGASLLVNPPDWCAGGTYANSANDIAYKDFDLSGIAGSLNAAVNFEAIFEMSPNDFFAFAKRSGGGDPFGAGGQIVFQSSGSELRSVNEDISACAGVTCSLGFRLTSDAAGVNGGAAVGFFEINSTQSGSNEHRVLNGTSMATPHVAGLAATIWAHNPSYTYADVVSSVKSGGDAVAALQGNTVTGRAVDAMGSLRFINPPTAVSAVVIPPPSP